MTRESLLNTLESYWYNQQENDPDFEGDIRAAMEWYSNFTDSELLDELNHLSRR